jgi:hypothetical protein
MKIIFIHIPKTAGFTIGRCLKEINMLKDGFGFNHHIAKDIIKDKDKNNIIMAVVRNPYDRLYSIYEFYSKKRDDIDKNITFKNFIMNFENKYFLKKVQFNTCFNFLIDNNNNFMTTDILKFENLSSEYDKFCKKYKITNNLKVMNENELKNVNINWNKLYDSEMQEVVEKIFKDDLINFNYSYEDFIKSK